MWDRIGERMATFVSKRKAQIDRFSNTGQQFSNAAQRFSNEKRE